MPNFGGGAGDDFGGHGPSMVGQAISDAMDFISQAVVPQVSDLFGKVFGTVESVVATYAGDLFAGLATAVTTPIDAILPGEPMEDMIRGWGNRAATGVMDFGYELTDNMAFDALPDNPLAGPLAASARDLRPFGWTGIWDTDRRYHGLGTTVSGTQAINPAPYAKSKSRERGLASPTGAKRKKTPFYKSRQYGSQVRSVANGTPVIYQ